MVNEDVQEYQEYLEYLRWKQSTNTQPEAPEISVGDRVKRNFGLHTRAALEGAPGIVDMATSLARIPVNKAIHALGGRPNYFPGLSESVSTASDAMGLPKPENAPERVSTGLTRLFSGAAPYFTLPKLNPQYLSQFGDDLATQAQGLVGAGVAGEAARETDQHPYIQFGASLFGGLAAPKLARTAASMGSRFANTVKRPFQNLEDIAFIMKSRHGVDINAMSVQMKASLLKDIQSAQASGQPLSSDAIRRLADFYKVGATPTAGAITRDPRQFTREQNAMRIAANTDDAVNDLQRISVDNNKVFIGNLNAHGANRAQDGYTTGKSIQGAIKDADVSKGQAVDDAYNAYRASTGRDVQFNAKSFYNDVIDRLVKEGSIDDLSPSIMKRISSYVEGKITLPDGTKVPISFNNDEIKTLERMISRELKKGSSEAYAAGVVRKALADVVPDMPNAKPGTTIYDPSLASVAGFESKSIIDNARKLAASRFSWRASAPAIKKTLEGQANPDTFMENLVISKSAGFDDVKALVDVIKGDRQAFYNARNYVAQWLKTKALNGSTDDVGLFSQAGYNKALTSIGDKKLSLFFDADEVEQLKALGRVAANTQKAPPGSAVNYSNSGTLMAAKILDGIAGLSKFIPAGKAFIGDATSSWAKSLENRHAQNIPQALRLPSEQRGFPQNALIPPVLYGGLLSTQ